MKPGSCVFPLTVPEEAATKEISKDAAVATVSWELEGVFILKGEQKLAPKSFLGGEHVFFSPLTGFGKILIKHCDTSQLAMESWRMANAAPVENPQVVAT